MSNKNKDEQRAATKERVQKHREKKALQKSVTCSKCLDRGFIEFNHGLLQQRCSCKMGKEYIPWATV